MQRVTITLDDELMKELDAFIAARGFSLPLQCCMRQASSSAC